MRKILFLIVSVLLLSGCASIFGGGADQNITIKTEPQVAMVVIKAQSGQVFFEGKNPLIIKLPRKNSYTVEVTLEGYQKQTFAITQGVNGWFWGNLCVGIIVGGLVDFATGAMWNLQPNTIDVTLKTAMTKTDTGPVLVFFTRDDAGQLRSMSLPFSKI